MEQFTAQLSLPAGQIGVMLGADTATVVITDNDSELHVARHSNYCTLTVSIPSSPDITIGFENETYSSDEGQGSVEVCARVIDGGLQRDVEVTLITQDGSAVGTLEKDKCVQLKVFHELFCMFLFTP